MLIKNCSFDEFKNVLNHVEEKGRLQQSFQIVDIKNIEIQLAKKNCLIFFNEESVVLLIPVFDYYDTYVFFTSLKRLNQLFLEIKATVTDVGISKLRLSLCGKEKQEETDYFHSIKDLGFIISKKIARYNLDRSKNKKVSYLLSLVPEQYRNAEYAKLEDAEQILDLMLSEFDPIGDAVPELNDIREQIRKKSVVCIKNGAEVIAFHYFQIVNNIYFGLFDYTKKNYRNHFLLFAISAFLKEHLPKNIKRGYGWRDVNNKRTSKYAKENGECGDGIFVWNLCLSCEAK